MSAPPVWFIPFLLAADFFARWAPHRCAVVGKTRVKYSFCSLAETPLFAQQGFKDRKGTGTIVAFERSYVGPDDSRRFEMGTYESNPKFPRGYIVKPDDGNALVCVPRGNARLIDGYRYAIPALSERPVGQERIGPLPQELRAYPDDIVRLYSEGRSTERTVGDVYLTSCGTVFYQVQKTSDEIARLNQKRKAEAEARGRAWVHAQDDEPHSWVQGGDIELVRRGNLYHLNNGRPEDLVFASLEEEVRFFAHRAGLWLGDEDKDVRASGLGYSKADAIARMHTGEFEIVLPVTNKLFTPIRLLPRYKNFRNRARVAGIAYCAAYL